MKFFSRTLASGLTAVLVILGVMFTGSAAQAVVTPSSGPVAGGTIVTIEGIHFVQVAAGRSHTLALTNLGSVYAWGGNNDGELGNGTLTDSSTPVVVMDAQGQFALSGVTQIAVGDDHSVVLLGTGEVYAWGENNYGQLGDGSTTNRSLPTRVKDSTGTGWLTGVRALALGSTHSAAILLNGNVMSWGDNLFGQLGIGTLVDQSLPVQVKDSSGVAALEGVMTIALGQEHSLAVLESGQLMAWGENFSGQLGDGTTSSRSLPINVSNSSGSGVLSQVASVAARGDHSLALLSTGESYAWGKNNSGQLGDGTTTDRSRPIRVMNISGNAPLTGATKLIAGYRSSYAHLSSGELVAWGRNSLGELGSGTINDSLLPANVLNAAGNSALTDISHMTSGSSHVVVVQTSGSTIAWGDNSSYELGIGLSTHYATLPQTSANFQPTSVSFGSALARNLVPTRSTWTVTNPDSAAGRVDIIATAHVFGGATPANPDYVSWNAGSFTYEPALAATGLSTLVPLGVSSALAFVLGLGILAWLRRDQKSKSLLEGL